MVMANLHLICGNCGNGDKKYFEYKIVKDVEGEFVFISCKSCATSHELSDNAKLKEAN